MKKILFVLSIILLFGTSCQKVGPTAISVGRSDFNEVIQRTNGEQLLLNLVRLKYREEPYFLNVNSVASSPELEMNVGGTGTFPDGRLDSYGASLGSSYSDNPTISYAPLAGEDFVRRLMTPVSPETLALLDGSGWSTTRVLRTCVQEINGIRNAPTAEGPTPKNAPDYQKFQELLNKLEGFNERGAVELGNFRIGEQIVTALKFDLAAVSDDEVSQLGLGIKGIEQNGFRFFPINYDGNIESLNVRIRSLNAMLFYVSQGVQAPESHREKGYVTTTTSADGSMFDWTKLTGNLMQIQSDGGLRPPSDSYLRVRYRGHWYYISDADLNSKSTFLMLQQLFALQGGNIKTTGPALTLSVGGN